MQREIGSNFYELNLTNTIAHQTIWQKHMDWECCFFRSGRNSIKGLISNIKTEKKIIVFPNYLCTTELDGWIEDGWELYFYNINEDLSIDTASLVDVINKKNPSVIWIQQYFGYSTLNEDVTECLNDIRKNRIIIEDITHNWFSDIDLYDADFYVASLRKFFAVADGGLLLSKRELSIDYELVDEEAMVSIAKEAFRKKKTYMENGNPELKISFRNDYENLLEYYSENDNLYNISRFSKKIIDYQDYDYVIKKRRLNANYIMENLKDYKEFSIMTNGVNDATIPLYVILFFDDIDKRSSFQKLLVNEDIYVNVYWQVPSEYKVFFDSSNIYDKILTIPIDQRYDLDDMDRILSSIKRWSEKM